MLRWISSRCVYSELCSPVEWAHNSTSSYFYLKLEIVDVFNTNLNNFQVCIKYILYLSIYLYFHCRLDEVPWFCNNETHAGDNLAIATLKS